MRLFPNSWKLFCVCAQRALGQGSAQSGRVPEWFGAVDVLFVYPGVGRLSRFKTAVPKSPLEIPATKLPRLGAYFFFGGGAAVPEPTCFQI